MILLFAVIAALFGIMALSGSWTPKLGLDLRGGTTITLTARTTTGQGGVSAESLEQARTIIQQRVDSIGVGESEVATVGNNQITVSVPNVAPAQLQEMVGTTAQLYFRPVYATAAVTTTPTATPTPTTDPSASAEPAASASAEPTSGTTASAAATPTESVNRRPAAGLPTAAPTPRPTTAGTPLTTDEALAWTPTARDQADFEAFQCGDEFPDVPDQPLITCNREGTTKFLLYPAVINGDMLTGANAGVPQNQLSWIVQLQLNDEGGKIFEQVTGALAQKSDPQNTFAIVLDSKVVTYPRLTTAISGGRAEISGSFTQQSATDLANVLKYGSLPLAFDLSEVSNVSATLGGEQLQAGIIAGLIGLVLVVIYSVIYYRALSIVVVASLVLAATITYQLMVLLGQSMGFALNLPGIAGAIVAIGMTADSFIIYFERIRDEVRDGRSLRTAIETGWIGSRKTILIADAVSLLSAAVLFFLAIGSVKGFAFTLGLTTLIDIAIVFWFTKPMVTLLGRTKYFGEGRRFSGFDAAHLGAAPRRSPIRRLRASAPKEA
ncbi:MAG TPA: protein translocase subunit SecD [Propioniciclava sp.]|uniref:protein translocase subunit SecD n=1 Tax=Propioniciclava sp. TaxID=2038686 RepID=UPI002CB4FDB1|nr:protein translocase subunit SecD [Propioniciclava sp.]HRL49153.1 protein translocase subunit SecD [Propioniciclava sp.]HRL79162.1 protein translocase subunit SecD [Propioniciclava sp.]